MLAFFRAGCAHSFDGRCPRDVFRVRCVRRVLYSRDDRVAGGGPTPMTVGAGAAISNRCEVLSRSDSFAVGNESLSHICVYECMYVCTTETPQPSRSHRSTTPLLPIPCRQPATVVSRSHFRASLSPVPARWCTARLPLFAQDLSFMLGEETRCRLRPSILKHQFLLKCTHCGRPRADHFRCTWPSYTTPPFLRLDDHFSGV